MDAMAKIITFNTFCYRRELKAIEKEITREEERRRQRINKLIDHAKNIEENFYKKYCNWGDDNKPKKD
jgi:hypothetical protein